MTSTISDPAADEAARRRPAADRVWYARQVLRGPAYDPPWARPALLGLLAATAVLYLWGLGASGWANSFYSAAVQAGASSWKAFFFGSSDAAGAITVDKTPAALWPMALTARVFGVNSWSILVPQALMGVATVGVLYGAVRRSLVSMEPQMAAAAGPLAGAAMAVTPVAALMFRFNNPDALLVLLLTLGAYAMVRALEQAGTGWLALAGAFVGFAFLAKMLQAFLVVPAFALVYLVLAPTAMRRRIGQLLVAGLSLLAAAGWWVAIVALVPAGSRPYIGGSQHNNVLELALGYNGLGRLNGDETGGLGNLNRGVGWTRMFGDAAGGQISWLLPAALMLLVAGLWATWRAPRADPARAGLLLWGGWLAVHLLIFSFMQGIFHEYYTVALAPAVAALAGLGAALLWRRRAGLPVLAGVVAVTALWSYVLLGRTPDWQPWLRWAVVAGGITAVVLLGLARSARRVLGGAAALAVVVSLAGPAAYALDTASSPHVGAIPTAGPSTRGPGGMRGPGRMPGPGGGGPGGGVPNWGGRPPGMGGAPQQPPGGTTGGPGGPGAMGRTARGPGGFLNAAKPSAELTALLKADSASYTWVAAAAGSNNAAGYQLATGEPVMAVGGFNGTDPSPTLAQFQRYVREGKIHYFVGGGMGMMGRARSGSDTAQQIAAWVEQNHTARIVGGVTIYDLTQG